MEAWIAHLEAGGTSVRPERREELLRLDAESLVCTAKAIQDYTEQSEALTGMTAPSLFYAGTEDALHDGVKRAAALFPGSRFISFPGLDHCGVSQRAELVLPQVLPFLNEVTAGTPPR